MHKLIDVSISKMSGMGQIVDPAGGCKVMIFKWSGTGGFGGRMKP